MRIRKQYQVIPTNAKLENGDSTSATNGYTAEYINDHSVVVSPTEPSGSARKKVWKQHSKNLFNKNNYISTSLFVGIGGTSYQTASTVKGFIFDVSNYTTLTISKISSQRFGISASTNYPTNGGSATYIHDVDYQGTKLTVDVTNYNYIVVNYYSTTLDTLTEQQILDTIQIELGTEATEYEPYASDKEYILNENDVYEEFKPQNEIYSKNETICGYDDNNKPVYRKVIEGNFSEVNTAGTKKYYTNLAEITNLKDLYKYDAIYSNRCPFSSNVFAGEKILYDTCSFVRLNLILNPTLILLFGLYFIHSL